ncbi:glyoxylase-like metal-dependent hydrolase (beta-lactamase superfamily II) [Zymomonas mobilis]|uniref:Glyoxylase-like metal-dependent hydrolase (Beta-lactamase superfamily II) n=1 Tax=Zymomonas mobilis TaxID=542 RepID=A0A542W0V5_ZYMMB|nr:MBL fold metallo-hydrolase [Zymomonas mobilis]TQL17210.1 glyoxylase-like metal-dependent hydrolase (beta-lactamase superfamily II) [Zymomonas mobilis]
MSSLSTSKTAPLQAMVIPVTPLRQNCSLLYCSETMQGAVVDPGGDIPAILDAIAKKQISIEKILITHGHFDHCGGAAALSRILDCPIIGPNKADQFWIDQIPENARQYGFEGEVFSPDQWLEDKDEITIGHQCLIVRHCPGHTPGHVVFYNADSHLAVVGDVLFRNSIGRSDFTGGDHNALIKSIIEKLWPMGRDTAFIPGHGRPSTFGTERDHNPFIADTGLVP